MKFLKLLLFPLLLCMGACGLCCHPGMNQDCYGEVSLGSTPQELCQIAGQPYKVCDLGDDKEEYLYIERLRYGDEETEQIHYLFRFHNGKLVDKCYDRLPFPVVQEYL